MPTRPKEDEKVDTALVKAMVIGDGCLRIRKDCKTPIITITHSAKQEEYLVWKKNLLEKAGYVSNFRKCLHVVNKYTGKRDWMVNITTRAYKEFLGIRNLMYPKTKGFPSGVLDDLGLLHLAIIFQDDGCKVTTGTVSWANGTRKRLPVPCISSYRIALQSHGQGSFQFCDWLMSKFGVTAKSLLTKYGYVVAIYRSYDKARFRDLISPFMHSTMMYKLEGTFEAHVNCGERLSERGFEETSRIMQQSELPGKKPEENGPKSLFRFEQSVLGN